MLAFKGKHLVVAWAAEAKGDDLVLGALKGILKIVSTILVGIVVVLAISLVGVRLLGVDVYTVLSGSMEPTYKTGSVIWVADREPEEIEVGDPITFVLNEDLVVATHRVIDIDAENQYFYTQGDANDAPDGSPVHFENLIGEPVFTVPYLGYLVDYIQSPPGTYVAISVGALLLMLMFLPDLFAKENSSSSVVERRERQAAQDARRRRGSNPGRHDVRRTAGQPAARPVGSTNRAVGDARMRRGLNPYGGDARHLVDQPAARPASSTNRAAGDAQLPKRTAETRRVNTRKQGVINNNPRLRPQVRADLTEANKTRRTRGGKLI